METIDNLIRFLNSYPAWAKAILTVGFVAILLVLVFAPRASEADPKSNSSSLRYYLAVRGVTLYPDNPSAEVQVFFDVNGQEFRFPSVPGVEWMKVGPAMSQKTVEIAPSSEFVVSFRMKTRTPDNDEIGMMNSKRQLHLKPGALDVVAQSSRHVRRQELPFSGTYDLYNVVGGVRSAAVSATIKYELYTAK